MICKCYQVKRRGLVSHSSEKELDRSLAAKSRIFCEFVKQKKKSKSHPPSLKDWSHTPADRSGNILHYSLAQNLHTIPLLHAFLPIPHLALKRDRLGADLICSADGSGMDQENGREVVHAGRVRFEYNKMGSGCWDGVILV